MGVSISLASFEVYEEPIQTKYRAASYGAALLETIALLSVLILPFIIGIEMGQFWKTHDVVIQTPTVVYTGKCLLKLTTTSGEEKLWASSAQLQSMLAGDPRLIQPFVSVLGDDKDGDGKVDIFTFRIEVPLDAASSDTVSTFEFLPAFQYDLVDPRLVVRMETAPFVSFSPPPPPLLGSGSAALPTSADYTIDGTLAWRQLVPLQSSTYVRYDRVYNRTLFDLVSDVSDWSALGSLAARYARRNESATFEQRVAWASQPSPNHQHAFAYGAGDFRTFGATVVMRVQPAFMNYVPSFAEVLKYGWVQYYCIAVVVHWVWFHIRRIFVKQAFIDTVAVWEGRR